MSYSRFIAGLNAAGVEVDRKVLADLAVTDDAAFGALVEAAKRRAGAREADLTLTRPASRRNPKVQRLRRLLGRRSARRTRARSCSRAARCSPRRSPPASTIEAVYVGRRTQRPVAAGSAGRCCELAPASSSGWPRPCRPSRSSPSARRCDVRRSATLAGAGRLRRGRRRAGRPGQPRHGAAHGRGRRGRCRGADRGLGRRPFNPKMVRASAGALFHVPVVGGRRPPARCGDPGVAAARRPSPPAGCPTTRPRSPAPCALVLGNEAHGLPRRAGRSTAWSPSRMAGRAESLNVGMAAARPVLRGGPAQR